MEAFFTIDIYSKAPVYPNDILPEQIHIWYLCYIIPIFARNIGIAHFSKSHRKMTFSHSLIYRVGYKLMTICVKNEKRQKMNIKEIRPK